MPPRIRRSDKRSLTLLAQCNNLTLPQINQIHSHLTVSGAISDPFAAAKLVSAAASLGDLPHAGRIFRRLTFAPSTFLWNAMIRAHSDRNQPEPALSFYKQMLSSPSPAPAVGRSGYSSKPNNYTFSFLLRSCLDLRTDVSLLLGRELHSHIIRLGWESYDFVQNGLIHLYAACNAIDSARRIFDRSPSKDVVSWTAMVHGYAKSGRIDVARELFDRMPEKNAVSWSAMITAYARVGMFKEALEAFNEMQVGGVRPNHAGIVGGISACGFLGALDQGRWIHAYAKRNGMGLDTVLGTALVDMYSKCGCLETAMQVFEEMPRRDVFAYTVMISGLSNHSHGQEVIDLFVRMEEEGVQPNEVTFICLLSACGRMGMVERGRELFEKMSSVYGILPGVEHYGCLVDLLGRAGLIQEAKKVVREMPMKPDSYVLGALLNGCREHGEVELAKDTVESLAEMGLDHSGVHVLMSNMYASVYRWEDVMMVRKGMEEKKVRKMPGCSLVEVDGVACEFVAGDRTHEKIEDIMLAVKGMDKQLKSFREEDVYC